MAESDEVEESLSQAMRVAVTSGARIGQAFARLRQQQADRRLTASEQRMRELQRADAIRQTQAADQEVAATAQRERAERENAQRSYRRAQDPGWWDTAAPAEVGAAYGAAVAWRDVDPEAAGTAASMSHTLRDRYDVDTDRLPVDQVGPRLERAVEEASKRETLDLAEAHSLLRAADAADSRADGEEHAAAEHEDTREDAVEHSRTAAPPGEVEEATLSAGREAEHRDEHLARAAEDRGQGAQAADRAESVYDSASRRQTTSEELRAVVDHPHAEDAIAAKMAADTSQAKPIREAVQKAPGRATSKNANTVKKAAPQQHRSLRR